MVKCPLLDILPRRIRCLRNETTNGRGNPEEQKKLVEEYTKVPVVSGASLISS